MNKILKYLGYFVAFIIAVVIFINCPNVTLSLRKYHWFGVCQHSEQHSPCISFLLGPIQ